MTAGGVMLALEAEDAHSSAQVLAALRNGLLVVRVGQILQVWEQHLRFRLSEKFSN